MADESLFAAFYVKRNCDGIAALEDCGFTGDNGPLRQKAMELLGTPEVKAQLRKMREAITMDSEECLQRLSDFSRGTIAAFLDDDKNIDIQKAMDAGLAHTCAEYKVTVSAAGARSVSVKLYSALDATKTLAKHFGLLDPVFKDPRLPTTQQGIRDLLAQLVAMQTGKPETGKKFDS